MLIYLDLLSRNKSMHGLTNKTPFSKSNRVISDWSTYPSTILIAVSLIPKWEKAEFSSVALTTK